jgi:hypothetical protein
MQCVRNVGGRGSGFSVCLLGGGDEHILQQHCQGASSPRTSSSVSSSSSKASSTAQAHMRCVCVCVCVLKNTNEGCVCVCVRGGGGALCQGLEWSGVRGLLPAQ